MAFYETQNKLKAVTFSYDDGVTQDIRLIELLNKYGLKCTFNLNSELLGKNGILKLMNRNRISMDRLILVLKRKPLPHFLVINLLS